ncbi:hypothetical protein [Hymenobacter sp. DG01]|uniref:hypothetical protein n=1 Tax=Hymenobacter sp. DG01 TaxID=2584940 RepID=UPI001122FE8C|nr:hypothetical protein [Hymenobacter sp. DG01]
MNEAHLHLLLNHSPLLTCLFGLVLLLIGLLRPTPVLIRTGLWTILVAAVLCLPTQLTGEGAEEALSSLPGISPSLIQAHEKAAELGFWALELTGALALVTLQLTSRLRLMAWLTVVGALLSLGLLARAANLGGAIRHPEIRAAAR